MCAGFIPGAAPMARQLPHSGLRLRLRAVAVLLLNGLRAVLHRLGMSHFRLGRRGRRAGVVWGVGTHESGGITSPPVLMMPARAIGITARAGAHRRVCFFELLHRTMGNFVVYFAHFRSDVSRHVFHAF